MEKPLPTEQVAVFFCSKSLLAAGSPSPAPMNAVAGSQKAGGRLIVPGATNSKPR
ncbi:hypothetical protein NST23_09850 [Brevibacillus sp. FSL K6-0770]|uniref:hypothetical protein n=1 Tax=Brevibacillus TaxID=55080 RepID=UPI00156AB1C4|nr:MULTISPECIES: hypothetical protein [Brevibacillus]MDR5000784.1 hypothetical protein [Brevibacillus parabrevis]NRQ55467.1 hypothetical protein [Brevibacillus sp. HD1.4A]